MIPPQFMTSEVRGVTRQRVGATLSVEDADWTWLFMAERTRVTRKHTLIRLCVLAAKTVLGKSLTIPSSWGWLSTDSSPKTNGQFEETLMKKKCIDG